MNVPPATPCPPEPEAGSSAGPGIAPAFAVDEMVNGKGGLRPHWRRLVGVLSSMGNDVLAERTARLERAFAEEGITGLLPHAQPSGWRCDPVPLLLTNNEFIDLQDGLAQRAELLERVLNDLYGPQTLLAEGLLPPELVYNDPHFLRACHSPGTQPTSPLLHFYAADLARGPDGVWRVLADHTDSGGGIARALENRRMMARVLPEIFPPAQVGQLRPFFDLWESTLQSLAPAGKAPAVALLTGGHADPLWFEHVVLSRELSCALVESADLTVRDGQLFLKTLHGLQPVNVLLRRVHGNILDPLELAVRGGVPGLLDSVRGGALRVVSHPGSALAKNPGLMPLMPRLCKHLLHEPLRMESAPAGPLHLSLAPCATPTGLTPRPVMLRMFLLHDGTQWRALPGGLAKVLNEQELAIGSMPRTGLSKDVWVMLDEGAEIRGHAQPMPMIQPIRRVAGDLPSRVADNFFWLGRYLERLESGARLQRAVIARLTRATLLPREMVELDILVTCLVQGGLMEPEAAQSGSMGMLRNELARGKRVGGLNWLLEEISNLTEKLRDRLTGDMYATVTGSLRKLMDMLGTDSKNRTGRDSAGLDHVAHVMTEILHFSATVAGLTAENMVRGGGRLFLELGRRVERARATSTMLAEALSPPEGRSQTRGLTGRLEAGLRMALELCDSMITYRSRYLTVLQPAPVLDLVLADAGNPRSLAFQLSAIRDVLAEITNDSQSTPVMQAQALLAETSVMVEALTQALDPALETANLAERLNRISEDVGQVSADIERAYFTLLPSARAVGLEETDMPA